MSSCHQLSLRGLPRPLEALQNAVFDQYNRLHPRQVENNPVFIIDIDEKSLELLGQFPWPRQIFSDIITSASASGAGRTGQKPSNLSS